MELSVVMPCLNEAETVETCVRKTVAFIADQDIDYYVASCEQFFDLGCFAFCLLLVHEAVDRS